MSDWASRENDLIAQMRARGPGSLPATASEAFLAGWARNGTDTAIGAGAPYREAFDEFQAAFEKAAGMPVAAYAVAQGQPLRGMVSPDDLGPNRDELIAAMTGLIPTLPEERRAAVAALSDVRRRAAETAQAVEHSADETWTRTYGIGPIALTYLAGIARQAVDPVNLAANIATAPLGGPAATPWLTFLGRQALAGAAAQLAVEPFVEAQRADLGLDAGAGRATVNVAQAAAGGAALAGLFRGAVAALRWARGGAGESVRAPIALGEDIRAPEVAPAPVSPVAPLEAIRAEVGTAAPARPDLAPEDFAAAARLAERDHVIDGAALPEVGTVAHVDAVAAAARAIDGGGLPPPEIKHPPATIADDDLQRLAAAGAPEGEAGVTARWGSATPPQVHDIGALTPAAPSSLSDLPLPPPIEVRAAPARGPIIRDPQSWSLFEFLAVRGGIALDDQVFHGELKSLNEGNPRVYGAGPVFRRSAGMRLDQAREASAERGYLPWDSTVTDFLDLLDAEARGQKRYVEGYVPEQMAAAKREEHLRVIEDAFDRRITELQITQVPKGLRKRALQIMDRHTEGDALVAYERALLEKEDALEAKRRAREAEPDLAIPGWDDVDSRTAPQVGGDPASRLRERSGDAGAGERARRDRAGDRAGVKPLGDPVLAADAQRVLTEAGGDLQIRLSDNPEAPVLSARAALVEAAEDAGAYREFLDCLGGAPVAAAEAPF